MVAIDVRRLFPVSTLLAQLEMKVVTALVFSLFGLAFSCTSKIEVEITGNTAARKTPKIHYADAKNSEVALAWSEVAKAVSYKIIISTYKECMNPIAQVTTRAQETSATISLTTTESRLFVCIEAIDERGSPMKGAVSKGYEIAIQGSVPHHVATPVATPAGNNFSNNFLVTLSTVPMSASIYYTTDGTTPTTSSAIYTGAITVSGTTVLKALGVLNGYSNSSVMTEAYTLKAATPTADISHSSGGAIPGVSIHSTSTVSLLSNFILGTGQNLNIASGILNLAGFTLTVPGTLDIAAGSTMTLSGGAYTAGTLNNNDTIN